MSDQRGIAILGCTGSIGRNTLAVIALHPERFRVVMLGALRSWQIVVEQALQFSPEVVVLVEPEAAAEPEAAEPETEEPTGADAPGGAEEPEATVESATEEPERAAEEPSEDAEAEIATGEPQAAAEPKGEQGEESTTNEQEESE